MEMHTSREASQIPGRVLLVSLNSLNEQTGGGMYLRSLCRGLARKVDLQVLAKSVRGPAMAPLPDGAIEVDKGAFQDLVARLLLQPTFMAAYVLKVIRLAATANLIIFQSSRHGGLIALVRLLLPGKRVICVFDNIEQHVLEGVRADRWLKRAMDAVDRRLLPGIERRAYLLADACSFITQDDADFMVARYGAKRRPHVIVPISLPSRQCPVDVGQPVATGKLRVLFTASFDFPPNQTALREFIEIASGMPGNFEFLAAGRGLDRLVSLWSGVGNFSAIPNPSPDEMQGLFQSSSIYLTTVRLGSGMKTKVAEALSFGLPVIATGHSLVGYEGACSSSVVVRYDGRDDARRQLVAMASRLVADGAGLRAEAVRLFRENYSEEAIDSRFDALLTSVLA